MHRIGNVIVTEARGPRNNLQYVLRCDLHNTTSRPYPSRCTADVGTVRPELWCPGCKQLFDLARSAAKESKNANNR